MKFNTLDDLVEYLLPLVSGALDQDALEPLIRRSTYLDRDAALIVLDEAVSAIAKANRMVYAACTTSNTPPIK